MRRAFASVLALTAAACAPQPVRMPAAEASELLARFAAGSGQAEICTNEGRAMLRGIEASDSVVLDPHKSLHLLVRPQLEHVGDGPASAIRLCRQLQSSRRRSGCPF